MNFKQIGNKRDEILCTVMCADQTLIGNTTGMPPGIPLILQYPGGSGGPVVGSPGGSSSSGQIFPENGLGVILPSSAAAGQAPTCFYGVNTGQMLYQQQGAAMVSGYYPSAVVVLATRAATTNAWTATTLANWAILTIDTVNNAFAVSATTAANNAPAFAILLGAISQTGTAATATATTNTNTFASSASSTADTRTVITAAMRIQVRCL